jgi:hypothetical protein
MDIWINNLLLKDGEKDYTHINLPLWMENFMVYLHYNILIARGGADDHYSVFGSVLAVKTC